MNDNPQNPFDPVEPGSAHQANGPLLRGVFGVDRFWRDRAEAPGLRRGVHVYVACAPNTNRYQGLITVGCGRGSGYMLSELAQQVTRKLEARFNVPAQRVEWAIRLLTPPAVQDRMADGYDEDEREALADSPRRHSAIGRTDLFKVEVREDGRREAVAVTPQALGKFFYGVLVHQCDIPQPPLRLDGFAP